MKGGLGGLGAAKGLLRAVIKGGCEGRCGLSRGGVVVMVWVGVSGRDRGCWRSLGVPGG